MTERTWDELKLDPVGFIYDDGVENDVRYVILRGPSHLCAYVGVPSGHPLSNHEYYSIPLKCHGGLTYGGEGKGSYLPSGLFWYGWDYGHCDDYATYYDEPPLSDRLHKGTKWTPQMVRQEIWSVTYNFRELILLAEKIRRETT